MTTREDRFALDLANRVAPLRVLLAEYADDVLREYRGVHLGVILGEVVETPLIITAGDTGAAAEKT